MQTRGVGNRVRVDVLRKGKPVTISIALRSAPAPGKDDLRDLKGANPFDGARVANLSNALSDELGLEDQDGVVIVAVRAGSTAQRLGFQTGDVIVQVGRDPVANVADLERLLAQKQKTWLLGINRGGRLMQLQVQG
jgi:S1-C subfamily serine protease